MNTEFQPTIEQNIEPEGFVPVADPDVYDRIQTQKYLVSQDPRLMRDKLVATEILEKSTGLDPSFIISNFDKVMDSFAGHSGANPLETLGKTVTNTVRSHLLDQLVDFKHSGANASLSGEITSQEVKNKVFSILKDGMTEDQYKELLQTPLTSQHMDKAIEKLRAQIDIETPRGRLDTGNQFARGLGETASMGILAAEAFNESLESGLIAVPGASWVKGASTFKNLFGVARNAVKALPGLDASIEYNRMSDFRNMIDQGVDPQSAREISNVSGVAIGALDALSLGIIEKTMMGNLIVQAGKKILSSGSITAKALRAGAIGAGIDFVAETGTEGLQTYISDLANNVALLRSAMVQENPALHDKLLSDEEMWLNFWDTVKFTAMGQAFLAPVAGGVGVRNNRAELLGATVRGAETWRYKEAGSDYVTAQALATKPVKQPAGGYGESVSPGQGNAGEQGAGEGTGRNTGYFVLDPGFKTGQQEPGRYTGDGVKIHSSYETALSESRKNSTAPISGNALLAAVEQVHPKWMVDMVQDVLREGPGSVNKYADQVKTWEEDNQGSYIQDIVNLADSVRTRSTLDDRNKIILEYRLDKALPAGSIRTVEISPEKTETVKRKEEIREAFQNGAQAVKYAGDWYVKNADIVTPIADQATDDPIITRQVSDYTIKKDGDKYTAISSDGTELGSLKVDTSDGRMRIKNTEVFPEYRRQGIADALLTHATRDNPESIPEWSRTDTVEGRALRESFRKKSPAWKTYGKIYSEVEKSLDRANRENIIPLKNALKNAETQDEAQDLLEKWDKHLAPLRAHKAFLDEKLDKQFGRPLEITNPEQLTPQEYRDRVEGPELDRESLLRILENQFHTEEAEAVLSIVDSFAKGLGYSTTAMLQKTIKAVELVNVVGYQKDGISLNQYANGVAYLAEGKRVIQIAAKGNVSTFIHEFIHALEPVLQESDRTTLRSSFADYLEANPKQTMVQNTEEGYQEWLARTAEKYFLDGQAPTPILKRVFDKLSVWFKWIYNGIQGLALPDKVHPEAKKIFDRLLSTAENAPIEYAPDGSTAPALYQPAYHGSPYDFDQFTTKAMGTGEGAQAYGWGLYFAGDKAVAEHYREALSERKYYVDGNELYGDHAWAAQFLMTVIPKMDIESAKKAVTSALSQKTEAGIEKTKKLHNLVEQLGRENLEEKTGQLYEVEIPDQDEYLDWDKPIRDQSQKVQDSIKLAAKESVIDYHESNQGELIYKDFVKGFGGKYGEGDRSASEILKSYGIPGITYLDGNSRSDGQGSYNYVIFADEDVKITRKLYQEDLEPALGEETTTGNTGAFNPANPSILYQDDTYPEMIDKWALGKAKAHEEPRLGWTTPVMKEIGWEYREIRIRQTELKKIVTEKHDLTIEQVKDLPNQLMNPVMVWDGSKDGTLVFLTNMKEADLPIIMTVKQDQKYSNVLIHRVTSAYGKNKFEEYLSEQVNIGKLRYVDKIKAQKLIDHEGLQLPKWDELLGSGIIIGPLPEIVNPLYQTDPDYRDAVRQIQENEKLLEKFIENIESSISEMGKGKGQEYRDALRRTNEITIKGMETQIQEAKDRLQKILEDNKNLPGKDFDPHMEFTRQAVEAGKVVPMESLMAYRNQDWAEKELARRELFKELIEEAKSFPDLESWMEDIESYESFADEPKSEDVAKESEGDKFRAQEIYKSIFLASRITTPAQADKQFLESLNEEKAKEILFAIARNPAAEMFKNLPVQTRHGQGILKRDLTPEQLDRALKVIRNNPRLYRRIMWTFGAFGRDETYAEMLAVETEMETFAREVEPEAITVEKISIPSDVELELRTRIFLGDKDRAWWTAKARTLEKEVSGLEVQLEELEKESDQRERIALQAGREARDSAGQEVRLEMSEKLEAERDARKSAIEEVRLELKRKQADLKAVRKVKDYHAKLAKSIMAPAGKSILADYRVQIEALQLFLDPKNRTSKTEARKAELVDWYARHPEALERMKRKTKIETFGRSLNLWTTEELETLKDEIDSLREQGRAAKKVKQDAEDAEIEDYKSSVKKALYREIGKIYDEHAKTTDQAKRDELAEKILAWESRGKDVNEATAKKFDRGHFKANFLTISNLANNMDGDPENYDGVNHKLLYTLPKQAENAKLKKIDERMKSFFSWMNDHGITMEELGDKIGFEPSVNFELIGNKLKSVTRTEYRIDELITVYVGQKNRRKKDSLDNGNKISYNIVQFVEQSPNFAKYRELGDMIIREYDQQKDRLIDATNDYEDEILSLEENYTPIERKNQAYNELEARSNWEQGQAMGVKKASTDKGMIKSRIDLAPEHQTPITLGEVYLWLKNIDRQEQYINMAPVVKRLNRVYGDKDVKGAILVTHGNGVYKEVDNYGNYLANNYSEKKWNLIESISAKIRGNAAISYMAWSLTTITKQIPAFTAYLPYCGPASFFEALGKVISNPAKVWRETDQMSEQVRARIARPELEKMEVGRLDGAARMLKKFNNAGMKGIPTMDKLIVLVGWNAVHKTALKNGMTHEAARDYADFITNKTQATTSGIDASGLFRNHSELVKIMTMFTSPLNKLFNEVFYSMPRAWKNRNYWKATNIGLSLILGGVVMWTISKGRPPDEPDEFAEAVGLQVLDLVPIIGSPISGYIRGFNESTPPLIKPVVSAVEGVNNVIKAVEQKAEGNNEKANKYYEYAAIDFFDFAGLALQVPTSQFKRVYRAAKTGNGWEVLGWREEEK